MDKLFQKNALYLLASKGLNFVFPLISNTYLMTVLDFKYLGILGFSQVVADFCILTIDFGFNLSGAKQVTEYTNDIERRNKIVNSIYYLKIIITLICVILINIAGLVIPSLKEQIFLINIFFVYVIGQSFLPIWFFQGIQKAGYITSINIIGKIALMLLLIFNIKSNDDYIYYPLILGASFMIPLIFSFYYMIKKEGFVFQKPNLKEIKYQYLSSYNFFIGTFNDGIINYLPVILLKLLLPSIKSNIAIGIYTSAERFIKPICYLTQPIGQALFPHVIEKRSKDINYSLNFTLKISLSVGLIMAIFSLFSFFIGPLILSHKLLIGLTFNKCILPYSILCILPFFYSQVRLLCSQSLFILNKEGVYGKVYLVTAIIMVLTGYMLVSHYEVIGAAMILPIANIIMFTTMGVYLLKIKYYD